MSERTPDQQALLDELVGQVRAKIAAEAAREAAIVGRERVQRHLDAVSGWSQRRIAAESIAELERLGFTEAQIRDSGVAYAGLRRAVGRR